MMALQGPVLICGGGPVGLALAVELGSRGIECMLIERGDGNVTVPKMSQVSTRTMEFCRRWGIAEEVKKAGWPEIPSRRFHLRHDHGRT